MSLRAEAVGQEVSQRHSVKAVRIHQIHLKIIPTEFPHHLAADTAGRELSFNDAVLAAADGNGHKIPVSVVDRLEESGTLSADGG